MVAYGLKPAGVSLLAGFLLATLLGGGQNKMPAKVLEALKTRFPNAEIEKWTREKEGDVVLYDIEFRQAGQKYEADIKEDGTIDNWERAIEIKDLPAAVRNAVDARYAKAKLKEVMAITAVKGGKDVLEGYEITLETAEKKPVEMTIAPGGRVLEDSGQKK
jgi:hypothetical protein